MITDSFGRVHDYLRISLTDNCNLRCFYCMPEEKYAFAPASRLMQVDEIETIAKLFVAQGVKKIRLTGGEPLVRKDAHKIIEVLGSLGVELAITTNGVRLDELLGELIAANVKSINISLDTLQSARFYEITRRDLYHRVRSNIELLLEHDIHVKINVVVMKGLNDDEILDFLALTEYHNIEIRFIEFMPFSGNKWTSNQVFTLKEIISRAESGYTVLPGTPRPNDTSKRFTIPGHVGSFSVISTMTSPFCDTCNRMRLTADGKLKNCLFSKGETDLLGPLRNGENILPLITETIMAKAKALGGQFSGVFEDIVTGKLDNRSMITIGG
ncbi:cyclic pyranopterin monophosphate synthase subunit MoaA [Pedobacter westerhofensis]|uniref:GTP 3',8-cyclase n=1 Tax=Pedobacter westerhofensis TaxID=425512 RepID=A0A521ATW3_9SPHI|nr:GTP 3',8-cyclase MoaA [Pedobacter westerhofensis]SMO38256.1 cyclic pyranopterin monophosphate synthase subunit MoaA [Pedobacter westerhofensis]